MDTIFTNQILQLGSTDLVVRAMVERRERILEAIAAKAVTPSEELMRELAELNIAIGDVVPAPLAEDTKSLLKQNAELRESIKQVDQVLESIGELHERVDRLFGKAES